MTAPRLTRLSDVTGAARLPGYDPKDHAAGIVHLGLGAFHRAHQAVMTDDALAQSGGDWRITGVSLRNRDVAKALAPQNGLYTLIERGPEGASARVIASIAGVIAADPAATLAALAAPATRIVSLTVTEKAYGIDRRTGAPDPTHPAVAADLARPDHPTGVLGLLTAALRHRRAAGTAPFTVLCCDNLPENGKLLCSGVIGFASLTDPALAEWIAASVAFPSTMVDRITPATTAETLRDATSLTGCTDAAAVETEVFTQWVIEDRFPQGRPRWEAGGAIFVADVGPFERMKLRMLNGSHSMLAYAGFLCGHTYVRDVMRDAALATLVARHLGAASASLESLPGMDLDAYSADLQTRFANPAIAHETYHIAMDGSAKLPQRILAPARDALDAGRDTRPFAFATALWMRYCLGRTDEGTAYALRDPRESDIAEALAQTPSEAGAIYSALSVLPGLMPDGLLQDEVWRDAVTASLATMLDCGLRHAVALEAESTLN